MGKEHLNEKDKKYIKECMEGNYRWGILFVLLLVTSLFALYVLAVTERTLFGFTFDNLKNIPIFIVIGLGMFVANERWLKIIDKLLK
ncbi:MAG: hypothetical protein WCH62_00750 [Candidatus Omnitrophota bacterium]